MSKSRATIGTQRRKELRRQLKRNYSLYFFLLPAAALIGIFCYAPMYGILMAFQNYSPAKGILGSAWVGLKWFRTFFEMPRFPVPILLALMVNSVKNTKFKKLTQTVTYMPHFISTVVLVGMLSSFLSPRSGFLNQLFAALGGPESLYYMGSAKAFPHLYVWSGIWQNMGWNSIIYLAALSAVDQELHEAAMVDGAGKLKRILHIDLPAILPTMVILLIMNAGSIMSIGYEKVYLMQNDLNVTAAEVISTYVYKIGLGQQQYSYSAAIGLFNNGINFILLIIVNKICKKISGSSLW